MLLTEQEAKERWCPMVRIARRTSHDDVDYSETNRGQDASAEGAHNCIGSACMAWRGENRSVWVHEKTGAKTWQEPAYAGHRYEAKTEHVGYCGLAGEVRE